MEREVKIAAKLYECRDSAKQLLGDSYKARMDAYGQIIKSTAKTTGKTEMSAAIYCVKRTGGVAALCYMAAAVELDEPGYTA